MAAKIKPHSKRFVAIDSNALVHRAFHAFPPNLSTSKGVQVNAVYGFTLMLLRVLEELKPKYLLCAFDTEKPTFRHTEYVDYKAQRKPPDKTLLQQIPMVKEVLEAFNIPILERDGYEADDILGTLAYWTDHGKWKSQGLEQIIVTGDRDLLQMVDANTKVWLPRGSFSNVVLFDEKEVEKLYGFGPKFVVDYKAIVGDSSDNVPGVKGVGEKTATELIKQFGHLEDIYKNLDGLSERQQKLMKEGKESALLSLKLVELVTNMDLDIELEGCLLKDFNYADVVKKFQEFEFRSLMKRIPDSLTGASGGVQMGMFEGGGTGGTKKKSKAVSGADEVNILSFGELKSAINKDLKYVSLCFWEDNISCMISLNSENSADYFYSEDIANSGDLKALVGLLLDATCPVFSYGWEDLCRCLFVCGIDRSQRADLFKFSQDRLFDVGLASYYLSTGQRDYSLNNLAFSFVSVVLPEVELSQKHYTKLCLDSIYKISQELKKRIEAHQESIRFPISVPGNPIVPQVVNNVDFPLSLSLAEMTEKGISVDTKRLKKKKEEMDKQVEKLQKEIFDSVGHEFNIDSPRQLSEVLFEELKLPAQKRTKTGYSTNESVLRKLKGVHPCIENVLEYRELVKLRGTYVEPLVRYAEESKDGRVHSTFKQTVTSTGRLSSQNPNLQNIPARSDLGKEIKSMFIAPKGRILIAADYSQIELRLMAHFSKDKLMLEDFAGEKDFHVETARRILGIKSEKVNKDERRIAKTINFGILYGLSPFGLSEQLGIERSQASEYINEYFDKYVGIKEYLNSTVKFVRKNGYVESFLGRRRYIPGVKSGNRIAREASEREAINMPLQSSASEIMRMAMNSVYGKIMSDKRDIWLLLQIHDELIFECNEGDAEEVSEEMKNIMQNVVKLDVPLGVEVEIAKSLEKT